MRTAVRLWWRACGGGGSGSSAHAAVWLRPHPRFCAACSSSTIPSHSGSSSSSSSSIFPPPPPSSSSIGSRSSDLLSRQLQLEESTHSDAIERYRKLLVSAVEGGRAASLKPVQRQLLQWILKLDEAIEAEQGRVWRAEPGPDRQLYGPLLVLLKSDKLAVIVVHEVVNLCLRHGNGGVPAANLCLHISESMQAEVNILRLQRRFGREVMSKLQNSGRRHVRDVNIRAKRALDVLDVADWPVSLRVKVGAVLVRMLMDVAVDEATEVPVFCHEMRWKGGKRRMRSTGILLMDDDVYERMLLQEDICRLAMPRYLPMLVAPRPWIRHNSGAYFRLKSQVMRTHGITSQIQALRRADLSRVYHGLNCLGRVPWRIHGELLDLIQEAWQRGLNVGDLPKLQDIPLAPPPQPGPREEDEEEAAARRRAHAATVRRTKRLNADLHSLRSDLRIKLTIADDFRDKEIYFPYNLDFRGRVYPVPPNLNHMGNDASRAVLRFSQELPLGERGWYWLRVHCANLYGEDKVSFDDRVSFTDRHMSDILDSAAAPLEGGMWWSKADYPWQCLAACIDIAAAIRGGDPTSHKSSLPIHQDGSCNGLQHYAALSRDAAGGHSVNLTPSRQPQDVYSGVSQRVAELVAEEARKVLPSTASKSERTAQKCALLLDGLIDRKVVKQTVMTSVYGVTFVGARRQIQARLEDKLTKDGGAPNCELERDVYECSFYVAKLTMTALGDLFSEARNTMAWLATLAHMVASEGQPMSWVTPLGLPVVQPYRKHRSFSVNTLLQHVQLNVNNDDIPVLPVRQKSAFPPNFVHSLDSTHMLMTAIEMDRMCLPFAAVHDSYWAHACNVDTMNATLRRSFVDLYSQPILENLHESLSCRFPHLEFPPVPERGELKVQDVNDSPYFFN